MVITGAAWMTIVYACDPESRLPSLASAVNWKLPAALGVPLIVPVFGSRPRPVGSEPEDDHKQLPTQPEPLSVCE